MNRIGLWIVLACALLVQSKKIPSDFKICRLSDANFEKCLSEAMEKAFSLIGSKGIPSLNLPSIDPIDITAIEIGAGSGAVNLVQHYFKAKFYGFSNQKISNLHLDMEKKILKFDAYSEKLHQTAQYELDGKILVIPVKGKGDCTVTFERTTLEHTLEFKEVTKNGKKYFIVDKYAAIMNPRMVHFEFLNLFDGNKALGDNFNNMINENWEVLVEDIKPGLSEAYGEVFKILANKIFESVPIDEIFLP